MATSQNGWAVDHDGSEQDKGDIYPGIKVPNGVLAGDVATVFRWLAEQYNHRVEPLVAGTCWGWFVKTIGGGDTYSNHSSGTAIDLNADQHPDNSAPHETMSQAQIDQCHAIEQESGGVLSWGGDWSDPDPMHWEIKATASEVAAFAKEIDVSPDQVRSIIREELNTFFKEVTNNDANKTSESRIGNNAFDQGIPDPYGTTKAKAYNVIKAIGVKVRDVEEKVDQVLDRLEPTA